MTAIETLERAISKLEELRDSAHPLPYGALTSGRRGGDHWYLTSAGEVAAPISANDGIDEHLRQPTTELLAALSRTVDPMLELLREALGSIRWTHTRGALSPTEGIAVRLARAILGDENDHAD